jgi:hypothetical protein
MAHPEVFLEVMVRGVIFHPPKALGVEAPGVIRVEEAMVAMLQARQVKME